MPTARATIVIVGRGFRKEAVAAAAITPGDLVEFTSALKYQRHSVAGGKAVKTFAVENELFGKGIATAYAANDRVLVESCHAGMEIYATLAANAAAIVAGDLLESAGDGTLRKVAAATNPADLTDNTTGTADGTLAALPNPTDSPATADALRDDIVANLLPPIRNNFADLTAQLNTLTPGYGGAIAVAKEAYDNSAVAAKARILVELL